MPRFARNDALLFKINSGIGLESCPRSNLHISAVDSYAVHPIKGLADSGVKICFSTDDPGISAITIGHEYEVAAPILGFRNAVDIEPGQTIV